MPEVITRRAALSLGRKRFYTGRPCKYGHDVERYTTSGGCIDCVNPKMPPSPVPVAVDAFTLPNGRVVQRISQDDAAKRQWSVFFTGQPCEAGHMAERFVSSGLCLECTHPTKYGPNLSGWWPFQPKPPLRVPSGTPISWYKELASLLQDEIPRLVQVLEKEHGQSVESPTLERVIYGMPHKARRAKPGDYTFWFPLVPATRGSSLANRPAWMRAEVYGADVPWIEVKDHWYGVVNGEGLWVAKDGSTPSDDLSPDPVLEGAEWQAREQRELKALAKAKDSDEEHVPKPLPGLG